MFENLVSKTGGNVEPAEQNRLSQQAWETNVVADGSAARGKTKTGAEEVAKVASAKKPDALKEHVKINDRCALDVYEHHWELMMPKVSVPFSASETAENKQSVVVTTGNDTVTSEKLVMDDTGIWTIKDDQGQSVEMTNQAMRQYPVDANHPEQTIELKNKDFDNGAHVLISKNGEMTLLRHQDHVFVNAQGTPEFKKEMIENCLLVGFNKKTGVTSVTDQGRTWPIKRR